MNDVLEIDCLRQRVPSLTNSARDEHADKLRDDSLAEFWRWLKSAPDA